MATSVTGVDKTVKIRSYTNEVSYNETCTISWTQVNDYTFKVKYEIGEYSYTVDIPSGESSHSIIISEDFGENIVSQIESTTGKMRVYLFTYKGDKELGSNMVTVKITIPDEGVFKPEITSFKISPSYSEGVSDNLNGLYIQGHTKPYFTITTTPGLKSTIKNCCIEEDYESMKSSIDFDAEVDEGEINYYGKLFNKPGTYSYTAQVTNYRGFTSNTVILKTIEVLEYYSPSVDMLKVKRQDGNSTAVYLEFMCNYASVEGLNKATVEIQYQAEGSAKWEPFNKPQEATLDSVQIPMSISDGFSETSSYNFKVIIKDDVGESASRTVFLPRYDILLHYPKEQKGFGIGKYVDNGNFEVGLESEFYNNVWMQDNLNVDGLISGANFGRFVYSGDQCLKSKGKLSGSTSYKIRTYLIKPFNFVYFRLYVNGLGTAIPKDGSEYVTLCTLKDEFKPAWITPFAVSGGQNCDVIINLKGQIRVMPWNGVPTTAVMYISGFYPLDGSSPLYVQNASHTVNL